MNKILKVKHVVELSDVELYQQIVVDELQHKWFAEFLSGKFIVFDV